MAAKINWTNVEQNYVTVTLCSLFRIITDCLDYCADIWVPRWRQNYSEFWWDQDLDELIQKSCTFCSIWKAAGRPRSGQFSTVISLDNTKRPRHGVRKR